MQFSIISSMKPVAFLLLLIWLYEEVPVSADLLYPVRLVGGSTPNSGRVEVQYYGVWGRVCSNYYWDIKDATVVCRQLGYIEADRVSTYAEFGQGTGTIWMSNVACTGSESSLDQCAFSGWSYYNYCYYGTDAGVVCRGDAPIITWNGQIVNNNSLVSLSVVLQSVSAPNGTQYPLVCQGITGGQWYQPNGVLFPLATPDPVSTLGGYGQRNVSGRVELYRGTPSVFPHGVQCCTNTTVTLCVGMYSDLTQAASVNLPTSNGYNYALSVAATYGPNITKGVQFKLLTPTNVDPPVFQLTCTSTGSPSTDVQWTINSSVVIISSTTQPKMVTNRATSTYNNILTVTGRAYGMYTCRVTTSCSPVCGGFTLNPRSTTSSLDVQAPPVLQPNGVSASQSGPTSVSIFWTAPNSGGPVARYDIYWVANGSPSTRRGSTTSTFYVLTYLQVGVQYNISVIAVGTYFPSQKATISILILGPVTGLQATKNTFTTITLTWQPPLDPNGMIIMYQVTYSTDEVVNTYNPTSPTVTITGLLPNTTYTFSVTAYIMTGIGTPQQVQSSTAAMPDVTGLVVSAINTTCVRVSWLAVQLPPDGYLTGYTVYYRSLPVSQSKQYTTLAFSRYATSGDINDLNPNYVYKFSVVAEVAIRGMEQLYRGKVIASLAVEYSTNSSCLQRG
ncbi:hypothetical protein EMCRGX_G023335 [Ephydatia muelleri]